MNHTIISIKEPVNEPVLNYAPGSPEKKRLKHELERMSKEKVEIPVIIGGKEYTTGDMGRMVMPHDHQRVMGTYHKADGELIDLAIKTAVEAQKEWERIPWMERAAINFRAAELISGHYRYILNAATMLNQSKTAYQAEIDATCEVADFLRFNAYYMNIIYREQPHSNRDTINRLGYRALEGFVFAVSPFNFTSIAANLPTAPALMGNTILWKPASTAVLSGYYLMQLFKDAGFPDGVINFIPGSGATVGPRVVNNYHMAGIHFTGSTGVFQGIWKKIGENIANYRTYPRIVGETGGKDFIVVHASADVRETATAIVRGGFEYQGQKCSAASRVYIPSSMWPELKKVLGEMISEIKMGDPMDFSNFMNAVIDEASFDKIMGYIETAKNDSEVEIVFGGKGDKSVGYFIEPTVILAGNPHFVTMEEEIFGPVVTCYLYDESDFEGVLSLCDSTSPYALTGAVFARDRQAILKASDILRHAAGNFYVNDKPTGAVVGEQPFGGGRASGTNDKAGSHLNLHRWVSPRAIKENLNPPTDFKYPFLGEK
ncbi:MAG: L-glutamate gamma-semialdehyde dehydrogenase [bacterium]|nr:L-glutamate gamma-semialdehyde dehydrogenase [bacterium]